MTTATKMTAKRKKIKLCSSDRVFFTIAYALIILLAVAFCAGYFTDNLKWMGIERKAKAEVEVVEEAPAEPAVEEAE